MLFYAWGGWGPLGAAGDAGFPGVGIPAPGSSSLVPHPGQSSGVGMPGMTGMIFPHEGHVLGPETSAGLKHMVFSSRINCVSSLATINSFLASAQAACELRICQGALWTQAKGYVARVEETMEDSLKTTVTFWSLVVFEKPPKSDGELCRTLHVHMMASLVILSQVSLCRAFYGFR